jgi:nitroreductase
MSKILDAIKNRKSVRKFDTAKQVSKEQLEQIVEAGMYAPQACNARPYEFIVVQDRGVLDKIIEVHSSAGMLTTASAAIIVVGDTTITRKVSLQFIAQDLAAVTENILLQATELGLGSCWCGVHPIAEREETFRKLFNLSAEKLPFNVIAVGYPDEELGSRGVFELSRITFID